MAYRSVSNFRETTTAKTTEAGETVRRTYLWERNHSGTKRSKERGKGIRRKTPGLVYTVQNRSHRNLLHGKGGLT